MPGPAWLPMPNFPDLAALNARLEQRCMELWHEIPHGALPGSEVTLTLEIDAEVPNGLDRTKVRTMLENAERLGFIDRAVR